MGKVPPYSVIVPGTVPGKKLSDGSEGPGLYCAVIVKEWMKEQDLRLQLMIYFVIND